MLDGRIEELVADGFPGAADSIFEGGGVAPAEGVDAADVHEFLRGAVGLGVVEDESEMCIRDRR